MLLKEEKTDDLFKTVLRILQGRIVRHRGGLATLPFLSNIADTTGWFTQADLAIWSQSLNPPPARSASTWLLRRLHHRRYNRHPIRQHPRLSYRNAGTDYPSIIIILIVFGLLQKFKENKYVKAAFYSLRPASTGLIAAAGLSVVEISLVKLNLFSEYGLGAIFDWKAIILAVIVPADQIPAQGQQKAGPPPCFLPAAVGNRRHRPQILSAAPALPVRVDRRRADRLGRDGNSLCKRAGQILQNPDYLKTSSFKQLCDGCRITAAIAFSSHNFRIIFNFPTATFTGN